MAEQPDNVDVYWHDGDGSALDGVRIEDAENCAVALDRSAVPWVIEQLQLYLTTKD